MHGFTCTKSSRGLAFSVDVLLALVLVVSVLVFVSAPKPLESAYQGNLQTAGEVDSVFSTLNAGGLLASQVDANAFTQLALDNIYAQARTLIPSGLDFNLGMREYLLDVNACRQFQTFSGCFPDANSSLLTKTVSLASPVKDLVHGKKFFLVQEDQSACTSIPQFRGVLPTWWHSVSYYTPGKALLASDVNITFDVNVSPSPPLECDQNITVTLSVDVPPGSRKPVDIVMVLDRSGSMSWNGQLSTTNAQGVFVQAPYTYLADGSAGLRIIDTTAPELPSLLSTFNTPGSATGVYVDGSYAYVADYDQDLRIVNISNKSAPTSTGAWTIGGSGRAYDVFVRGNYAYVAHGTDGLRVINITNKSSPTLSGTYNSPGTARGVWVDENSTYAYVADGGSGLRMVNISNKSAPTSAGVCYNSGGCNISAGTDYKVTVQGNYAFMADGTSGLRIIDVSNVASPALTATYNTPGEAFDVNIVGNTVYVADDTSLQAINVANKASPALTKSYPNPYAYFGVSIAGSYAHIAGDSIGGIPGLFTVDLVNGQKLAQAKNAAVTFVDFNGWNPIQDQMGLVSYSSSATLDHPLDNDFNGVKADINALVSSGGTATGTAINTATTELNGPNHNLNSLKFQVLLSDGQTNTGASSSAAATTAANSGIVIYTIGFGADADEDELQTIATLTGGKYYSATDANVLEEVYALIAQEIQVIANDANILTPIPSGTVVVDINGGTLVDGQIIFDVNNLANLDPWIVNYTFNIPCSSPLACQSSVISVPGSGTTFTYIDGNGVTQVVDWNVFEVGTFKYRDLNVDVYSGTILSQDSVILDVNVSNIGSLDSNSTTVNFYLNDPDANGTLLASASVPALCAGLDANCLDSTHKFSQSLSTQGTLWAKVNPNAAINECPSNNKDFIYCYDTPRTKYYILEYWAWKR
ncbi:MAG: VWA domain-containing protein [Candidatus Diapherotrites archaeon]|nr:VWA domain-containing protein [Candidatus Diapherotrites archaeon]